jgi:hypothetical protein
MIVAPNGRPGQWVMAFHKRFTSLRRAQYGLMMAERNYHPDACIVVVHRLWESWEVLRSLQDKSPQQVRDEQRDALEKWIPPPRPDPQLYKRRRAKMSAEEKSELGRRLAAARWGKRPIS